MPVPVSRSDDAYFAPLTELKLAPSTELYLGCVHATDGAAGTERRIDTARKFRPDFGIATECGMARGRTPQFVHDLLRIHAEVAN
jgi:hypothetical protein